MTTRKKSGFGVSLLASVLALGNPGSHAQADEKGADLRSAVQNPISSLYSLPCKFTFGYGAKKARRVS